MAKVNSKSKHHFLPKMYLKYFTYDANQDCVWRINPLLDIDTKHLKQICYELKLYEYRDSNNNIINENEVEDHYMMLENDFAPKLKQIVAKIEKQASLTQKEIRILYDFYQMMFYRHPNMLSVGAELLVDLGYIDNIINARNVVRTFGGFNLEQLSNHLLNSHNLIIGINNTSTPFITAAFPFSIFPLDNSPFEKRMLYFPLTPKIMLMFWPKQKYHKKFRYQKFTPELVWLFNKFVCDHKINKDFLLISNNKEILESFKEMYKCEPDYIEFAKNVHTGKIKF